jgi:hypothetical protein
MEYWNYSSMQDYQRAAKQNRIRSEKRARKLKRNPAPVEAKPGTRPLSTMSNLHPARIYGWDDNRTLFRDRRLFV